MNAGFIEMDENRWFNAGLAFAGAIVGLLAGKLRLNTRPTNGMIQSSISTMAKMETEVYGVLRLMRADMDQGFDGMKEAHEHMIRKLRKHDGDLYEIMNRLDKLEKRNERIDER